MTTQLPAVPAVHSTWSQPTTNWRMLPTELKGWRLGSTYQVGAMQDTIVGFVHYRDWRGDTVQIERRDPTWNAGAPYRAEHGTFRAPRWDSEVESITARVGQEVER